MRPQLPLLVASVALALAAIASPVAAGGPRTIRVDDDGLAGGTACAGTDAAPATIQAAVDASGPGDTIIVCPGRYAEQVVISGAVHAGLTVRAVRRGAAVVAPASVATIAGYAPIVAVSADAVTVQWLKVGARTAGTCQPVSGILVDGAADVRLQSNRIVPVGRGSTLVGSCGLRFGVIVTNGATRTTVRDNLILDHQQSGIVVLASSDANVLENSVRWWHTDLLAPVSGGPTCGAAAAGITPSAGISFDDSTGRIRRNAVSGPGGATRWGDTLRLAISVESTDRIVVAANRIVQSAAGVRLQSVTGGTVARNTITGLEAVDRCDVSEQGIDLSDTGAVTVRDNTVARMGYGILARQTAGATITGNVATDSLVDDCADFTGVDLGSIDNTWTGNTGATSAPAGLCAAS